MLTIKLSFPCSSQELIRLSLVMFWANKTSCSWQRLHNYSAQLVWNLSRIRSKRISPISVILFNMVFLHPTRLAEGIIRFGRICATPNGTLLTPFYILLFMCQPIQKRFLIGFNHVCPSDRLTDARRKFSIYFPMKFGILTRFGSCANALKMCRIGLFLQTLRKQWPILAKSSYDSQYWFLIFLDKSVIHNNISFYHKRMSKFWIGRDAFLKRFYVNARL